MDEDRGMRPFLRGVKAKALVTTPVEEDPTCSLLFMLSL